MNSKKRITKRLAKDGKKIGKRVNNSHPTTGYTIKVPPKFAGQDPRVEFHTPPKFDYEAGEWPDDEAAKHKFPPPKKHPIFRAKWMRFIDNVARRENFNVAHLDSLEILCDLYVEYSDTQEFIRKNGKSYASVGRQGEVWRFYPEVSQLSRVQAQIKEYSKMLGLLLKKDHGTESDGEKSSWE